MAGVAPFAVAGLGGGIAIGIVFGDPVPEEIERLVEGRAAIGTGGLFEEIAAAARQDADHRLFVESLVQDQRTARIATGGGAFIGQGVILEQVEVEGVLSLRIVEIGVIEILRIAAGFAEQERIDIVERAEQAEEIFGCLAAEVDAEAVAGGAAAAAAIAGYGHMIAGAARLADRGRGGQGREEDGPGRHVGGRCVQRRHRDVAIEETECRRVERVRIIGDVVDIIDAERRVGAVIVRNPVDHAGAGIRFEGEGHRGAAIDGAIVGRCVIIDAMGSEDDGARVDERSGANEPIVAIHDADTVHATVENVRGSLVVGRHDGLCDRCDAESRYGCGSEKGRATGARQQARAILANVHVINSPKTKGEASQLKCPRQSVARRKSGLVSKRSHS